MSDDEADRRRHSRLWRPRRSWGNCGGRRSSSRRRPTDDDLTDLVDRARRGGQSLQQLLVAVRDGVHRLALPMTGCPDDALDASQEIMVKILIHLSTFHGAAAFTTWVHRIAVNHVLDRKRIAVERLELASVAFAEDLQAGLSPVAPEAGPELDVLAPAHASGSPPPSVASTLPRRDQRRAARIEHSSDRMDTELSAEVGPSSTA